MKNLPWIILYTFINALFVYKYADMVTPNHLAATLSYVALATCFFFLQRRAGDHSHSSVSRVLAVGGLTVALYIVMSRLDPTMLSIGRYPALNEWIERFLNGDFPYRSESRPSGFPFLYLLSIPFHFAGETGILHIISFLIFSTIIVREFPAHRQVSSNEEVAARCHANELYPVILLASSPVFLYELVARSDLFTNMILILLYAIPLDRTSRREISPFRLVLLGVAGGCVLATRMIVALVYFLVLSDDVRKRGPKSLWLILGNVIGFAGVTLPFLAWDSGYFLTEGPFKIQASYMSLPTTLPVLVLALIFSLQSTSRSRVISRSAILLFVTILLPFLQSIRILGWNRVIFADRFDISYFAFCLPFIVLSFDLNRRASDGQGTG